MKSWSFVCRELQNEKYCPWHSSTAIRSSGVQRGRCLRCSQPQSHSEGPEALHRDPQPLTGRMAPSEEPPPPKTGDGQQLPLLSRFRLFATPWTVAHQAPLSMGFSRQEYWSGLPCPFPGVLPNPGSKPRSPTLQADSLLSEPPGKPSIHGVVSKDGQVTNSISLTSRTSATLCSWIWEGVM